MPRITDPADFLDRALGPLLDVLQTSDVRELEIQEGDLKIRLHRAPAGDSEWVAELAAQPDDEVSVEPSVLQIVSPLVGTFYRAGQAGAPPLVSDGTHVEHETVVGIVEALQVLTEVEAGVHGAISKVLATDGQPVEYGQALFEVIRGD